MRADPNYNVVSYEDAVYAAGFALFSARQDKSWSLTDCISFEVMRAHGLHDALTADHHFTQAGYHAVFEDG